MGHVSSLSAANLFVLEDGRLLTPRVEGAGIAGTRRRLVLERLAPALGLAVEVADIQPRQLDRASELFCCNAIRGLQPIARLGQQTWQSFPVSEALHQQYRNAIAC
jgi:4-amino-4-deoxychorismate lyase